MKLNLSTTLILLAGTLIAALVLFASDIFLRSMGVNNIWVFSATKGIVITIGLYLYLFFVKKDRLYDEKKFNMAMLGKLFASVILITLVEVMLSK